MSSFDPSRFGAANRSGRFGRSLHYFGSCDSTNTLCRSMAAQGAPEGTLVLADHQSGGKGRWGRTWESPSAQNLLFSLLLRPPAGSQAGQLTAVMGVALLRAVQALKVEAGLKWPNDLWVKGRKLSGMLLETEGAAVVAGAGINVNQLAFDGALQGSATSLALETGAALDREVFLAGLLKEAELLYDIWATQGFDGIREEWDRHALFMGEEISAGALEGRVEGLAADGGLKLRTSKGLEILASGEVERLRGV